MVAVTSYSQTKLFYASSCLLIDKKINQEEYDTKYDTVQAVLSHTVLFCVHQAHVDFNSVHIIEETSYRNTWFCNQRLNCKVVFIFSYIAVTLPDKKVIYEHIKIKQIPAISYKTILEVHQDMTQSLKNFTKPRGIKQQNS